MKGAARSAILLGYGIACVLVAVLCHTSLAPALNLGAAVFYYYFPPMCLGFALLMSLRGIRDLWL